MRLNRFLARAGIASRRKSDVLIESGAVRVNGEKVSEPGRQIQIDRDRVECQGRPVALPDACEYLLLHKEAGRLVTRRDMRGRPTVFEYFSALHPGTVAVGRLDMDTTGLLLMTDDGELAYRLMHPRYAVDKRYEALVRGEPDPQALERLRRGVELEDGPTAPAGVRVLEVLGEGSRRHVRLEICIHEGRKRQIRRMCKSVGHAVVELRRVALAGLELGDLPPGGWRPLRAVEIEHLRAQVGLECRPAED